MVMVTLTYGRAVFCGLGGHERVNIEPVVLQSVPEQLLHVN